MTSVASKQPTPKRHELKKTIAKRPKKIHLQKNLPSVEYHNHPAVKFLLSMATRVESKTGPPRLVHDEGALSAARGMLNPKGTYKFRIWADKSDAVVATNVTAGAFLANPIGLPEFAGVLSVLFDEYRVDKMICHIRPICTGGISSGFDRLAYAVSNDYIQNTVPSSWETTLARAESALVPACAQSGTAFYMYQSGIKKWTFAPPKTLGVIGSLVSGFIEVGQTWPGACLVYAPTTASNGTVTLTCWREFHLSFRLRE